MSRHRQRRRPARRGQVIGGGLGWLSHWTLRWIILVVGAVLLGRVVSELWSVVLPVLLALVLTSVLQPPARWLERRLGCPPVLAALAAVLGALAVVVLLVLVIAPTVGSEVVEIADSASAGLDTLEQNLRDLGLDVSQEQVDTLVGAVQDRLQSSASAIASGVLIGLGAVTNVLINIVLTLVLTFFFLKDGRRFVPWLRGISGSEVGHHLEQVATRAWDTLGGFVRTQALVGLIDAVLIGLGLLVVGVPLALPLAVLTFVAAFAPVVGAVTVGALAVLVALVANGWVAALIVLAIVLVVQQLEGNVFLPYLQGKTLNLHAGVVLLTIVLGSTLYGVAGAFLGVPAVAVGAVVLRYLNEMVAARAVDEPGDQHEDQDSDEPDEGHDDDPDDEQSAPDAPEARAQK